MKPTENVVTRWLLEGDAAIRWQTLSDVVGSASSVPSDATRRACQLLLDEGLCADGGINFGAERSETCITGMTLSLVAYFGCDDERLETIAEHLLDEQMSDGGWNCRRPRGATHSSMHTSISVLEGLRHYELRGRARRREVRAAQRRGREFLLAHRLFRSHRTGRVIKSEFKRFAFPPRWHYDVLRGLDHFQAAKRSSSWSRVVSRVAGIHFAPCASSSGGTGRA